MKRYTVVLDAYIWAENDSEAVKKAQELIDSINKLDDHRANMISLSDTPFGSVNNRDVDVRPKVINT